MTKRKFMMIDLTIFSILAGLSEFFSGFLFNYFNSGYYISLAIMITIIAIIRWSFWGVIPLLVSGIVDIIMNQNYIMTDKPLELGYAILFYVIAPLTILFVLFYVKRKRRDEQINTTAKFILYIIMCYLLLIIGKGIVILIIEHTFTGFADYFVSVSLSLVISLILLLIFKSKTDLIRDMDSYIEEVQMEERYERQHLKQES